MIRITAYASRTRAALAACALALACERAPRATDDVTTPVRAVRADSGVWSTALGVSRWRSVVRAGHVREVHETVDLRGSGQVTRVFEYDTARVLRRVTERTWKLAADTSVSALDTASADTSAREPALRRESVVDFQTDGPVLAARIYQGQAEQMRRSEMRTLYTRGYALLQRALR